MDQKIKIEMRQASADDLPFLQQMLFKAFLWNPDEARLEVGEFLRSTEFVKLLAGWGRPGDRGLIAEVGGIPVGAAWYRLWTETNHSYGFVDAATPELSIAVENSHRSMGVGRALMRALLDAALADGFSGLSLSVDPANHALMLYESLGFDKVGESGTSWTLFMRLL
jgi:ribosomal protein S18 acetylase RimI-like enzyme